MKGSQHDDNDESNVLSSLPAWEHVAHEVVIGQDASKHNVRIDDDFILLIFRK